MCYSKYFVAIIKIVQAQTPEAISEIQKYLNNNGPSPHLLNPMSPSTLPRRLSPSPNLVYVTEATDSKKSAITVKFDASNRVNSYLSLMIPKSESVNLSIKCIPSTVSPALSISKVIGTEKWKDYVCNGTHAHINVDHTKISSDVNELCLEISVSPASQKGVFFEGSLVKEVQASDLVTGDYSPPSLAPAAEAVVDSSAVQPAKVESVKSNSSYIPPPRSHRHTGASDKALAYLKSVSDINAWSFMSTSASGVKISTKAVEGVAMPMVRGDGIIKGWTVLEVLSVIKSLVARPICKFSFFYF